MPILSRLIVTLWSHWSPVTVPSPYKRPTDHSNRVYIHTLLKQQRGFQWLHINAHRLDYQNCDRSYHSWHDTTAIFKTLVVCSAGVWTCDLMLGRLMLNNQVRVFTFQKTVQRLGRKVTLYLKIQITRETRSIFHEGRVDIEKPYIKLLN